MSTPNKGQSSAPVTDKEATPIDGPDPEKFGPVSRFFINYVRPDRDLQIGTAKPEKDNLRQVSNFRKLKFFVKQLYMSSPVGLSQASDYLFGISL